MKLLESALFTLKKYADFSGRASRSEFWYFFVFVILANAVARVVDMVLGSRGYLPGPVTGLTSLLLFVPQVAVAVRRLHDVGRSGKELIAPLVMLLVMPLIVAFGSFLGRIVALGYSGLLLLIFAGLLTLLAKKGSTIPNKYGPAPTAFSFAR